MFNTKIFENGSASSSMNIPANGGQQGANIGSSGVESKSAFSGGNELVVPQPIDITYQRQPSVFNSRLRRESIAHSQGVGGVSWGSVTIGSWLKDEVMMFANSHGQQGQVLAQQQQQQQQQQHTVHQQPHQQQPLPQHQPQAYINPGRSSFRYTPSLSMAQSPPTASYLPDLEADYCKDYSCCGQLLPTLHDLLRHYEEAHISQSPSIDTPLMQHQQNRNRQNTNNTMHNIMETVSTNDVFLNNQTHQHQQRQQELQHQHQQLHHNQQLQQQQQSQLRQQQQQQHLQNNQQHSQLHSHGISPQFNMSQGNIASYQQPNLHGQQSPNQLNASHPMNQQHHLPQQLPTPGVNGGTPDVNTPSGMDEEDSMYIDDPARHLYVMEHQEHKPYSCPVIGCEKNYKNQNGLKYHRLHGHQNQTLKENPDGTISIIDPESNTPYLDGAGMEKDKPYRCEVCGKRYKNLNGLKYHRGHTTH